MERLQDSTVSSHTLHVQYFLLLTSVSMVYLSQVMNTGTLLSLKLMNYQITKRTAAETKSWVAFVSPLPDTGRCGFLGHWVKGEDVHWLRWVKCLPTGQRGHEKIAQARAGSKSQLLRPSECQRMIHLYLHILTLPSSRRLFQEWAGVGLHLRQWPFYVLRGLFCIGRDTLNILETGEKYGAKQNILIEKIQGCCFFNEVYHVIHFSQVLLTA